MKKTHLPGFAAFAAAALSAACALQGCGLLAEQVYVKVTESPLNWLELHYYRSVTNKPIRRINVRICGDGTVETVSGTSRLVSDSFAHNPNDANWDDLRRNRYTADKARIRDLFQELVNAELFRREKFGRSGPPSPDRFLAVRAAIDRKNYSEHVNMFEEDPELAEMLYNAILEYYRPGAGTSGSGGGVRR